jgi:hypothetical protein
MTKLVRILATLSVLVVVSACGSESGSDSDAASSNSSSSTSSEGSTDTASGSSVVSVSLHRTGGLKPGTVNRIFAADAAPPNGFDTADVQTALSAAAALSAADVEVSPIPANTCCDRYAYTVTIEYADGTTKTFSTIDGLPQPKVFELLLRALS